jgi:hypothetical protein
MLENTEEEIKNGHSSETVKQDKEYHNTMCDGHHYTQMNTNNVN